MVFCMARWKEETKIERVLCRKPNGEIEILVLESNHTSVKVIRKEKLKNGTSKTISL